MPSSRTMGPTDPPTPTDECSYPRSSTAPPCGVTVFPPPPTRPPLMSPPPTPKQSRHRSDRPPLRLRSNSGLSGHINDSMLRQYTDYNPDGSPRESIFGHVSWSSERINSMDSLSLSMSMSSGRRRSTALHSIHSEPSSPTLPIPDFFSRDVFQMVITNPTTSNRLLHFCQAQGCGEYVEFLIKVQEYARALDNLTAMMATISTKFTSITASSPIKLPTQISKSLNTDIRHFTTSLLPGMETLFAESRGCIAQRITREIYPAFIKQQLALCTTAALGVNTPDVHIREYPGLGDAFVLTDPRRPDNPIISTSDGFLAMTGFSREEVTARNCRFLQGPMTDSNTVINLRDRLASASATSDESVDLVLNYREDGRAFWNMLFTVPLADPDGRVRYFLGGQVNVSDTLGSSRDILRLLTFGSPPADDGSGGCFSDDDRSSRAPSAEPHKPFSSSGRRTFSRDRRSRRLSPRRDPAAGSSSSSSKSGGRDRPASVRSRDTTAHGGGKRGFFASFRRASPVPPPPSTAVEPPPPPSTSASMHPPRRGSLPSFALVPSTCHLDAYLPGTANSSSRSSPRSSPAPTCVGPHAAAAGPGPMPCPATYSRFLVMPYASATTSCDAAAAAASSSGRRRRGGEPGSLPVHYVSHAALDALGLGRAAHDAVLGRDVFTVLGELAGSPSVGKGFRAAVRDALEAGRPVGLEMLATPVGAEAAVAAAAARWRDGGEERGGGKSKGSRLERLVTRWVPLKDGWGNVEWVVLIVLPAYGGR